jgi:2,3-bisphosphoglycerate-dependent phosphoglycerate mutase
MPGPGLSEHGKDESRQAAAFLADKGVQHLFVSPFDRTTQTAEQMLTLLDLPTTFTQLVAEHAVTESGDQVQARGREFLQGVLHTELTCIAVVSHGSPIRQMLGYLTRNEIDLSGHSYGSGNVAPTAGIWHAHRPADNEDWDIELVFSPTETTTL